MARMTDFFEILKDNMNAMSEQENAVAQDIEMLFEEMLLDPEFDTVGMIDPGSNEFMMYADLGALPVPYR